MKRLGAKWMVCLLMLALAPAAWAAPQATSFTLGKYIPGDCWMMTAGVDSPERAWVDEQYMQVWDALCNTGIHNDVINLVMSEVPEEQKGMVNQQMEAATKLFGSVDWEAMVSGEVVFAERLQAPMPDYIMLTRSNAATASANATKIADIMKWIASFAQMPVAEEEMQGAKVWAISAPNDAFALQLFQKKDVVGFVTGRDTLEQVLGLMDGSAAVRPIVDLPRYKEAMALVPAPEHGVLYFDFKMLINNIEGLVQMGMGEATQGEEAQAALAIIKKVRNLVDVMDYCAVTMAYENNRDITYSAMRVQDGKKSSPLMRVFLDRKPFTKWDKFIPADATGFSVSGGIDLGGLYQVITRFVKDVIPNGELAIAQLNMNMQTFGFNPEEDIFKWWSGEMISCEMPAAVATAMGGPDSVTFIRVKDAELASQKIDQFFAFLSKMFQQGGQPPLMITPAQVDAPGFRSVTHPFVMMWVNLAIGTHEDWLVIGTSPAAVNKCLAVASGKAPSVKENARFKAEGLMPTGSVSSVSFQDTSNVGAEMGAALQMVGMFGSMAAAQAPPEERAVVQSVFGIIGKLGPVFQAMDFFSSQASVVTVDGQVIRTQDVVTYKKPKK
jgi:hypothetical protein